MTPDVPEAPQVRGIGQLQLRQRTRRRRRRAALRLAPALKRELRRARRRAARTTQKAASAPATVDAATGQVRRREKPGYAERSMTRHEFLSGLHERLRPRTYVEIGVNLGDSLGLATCPAIGIDPAYRITADIRCPLRLFKTTSDEFFEQHDLRDEFNGGPVDLGFIDGMHLAEFAYRDFVNLERVSGPASVLSWLS